jgi:hypothetical protein
MLFPCGSCFFDHRFEVAFMLSKQIAFAVVALAFSHSTLQAEWSATQVAVLKGFDKPECVVVDADSGMAYVSNVAAATEGEGFGRFWADDGTGFISRLENGKIDRLKWIDSTEDAKLNGPKGMCIARGKLWINDNHRLLAYPLVGGKREVIEIPDAKSVNDLAARGDIVYVTDTGTGRIHRLTTDGMSEIPSPEAVNGVTARDGKLFAVSWGLHEVYELDPEGKKPPQAFGLADQFESLDTIEALDDGSLIVSDFLGGKVCVVAPDRKSVRTIVKTTTPADVGLDRKRMLLYVPSLMKDVVEVYQLEN